MTHLSRWAVPAACLITFLIGLAFVFVRAPHPWGWEGIDQYRELAWAIARGEPYPSLERSWGYPLFLAFFYRVFGDRQWIPLIVQVAANALVPYLIYVHAKRHLDERVAAVAAFLAGVLSFNTVYTSTQAADSLCTVFVVASVVAFDRGCLTRRPGWFALSGLLSGAALMFRPNLLLFPPFLLTMAFLIRRRELTAVGVSSYLAAAVLVWAPWPIRNYQLTGRFIPATTHGGIQLWYGSLQTRAHFENWFGNPRAQLESSPFSYSLPDGLPIRIRAASVNSAQRADDVSLNYWTNHDPGHRTLRPARSGNEWFEFDVPPQRDSTVIMFFVDAAWTSTGAERRRFTVPLAGARDPRHHTVSRDHFGNLDLNGHLLDVFDVGAMADHITWGDALPRREDLDFDRDGAITRADVDLAIGVLTTPWRETNPPRAGQLRSLHAAGDITTLEFADGSSLRLPRRLQRTVDVDVTGDDRSAASNTIRSSRTLASVRLTSADVPELATMSEARLFGIGINDDFIKREPLWMDRYTALAALNIADDPLAFATASLQRVIRMFVVIGSSDNFRSAQFSARAVIFAAATILSVAYLLIFVFGVVVAIRGRRPVGWLLVPIIYIPATIFMMLPNMRYSVTVQPFILIFVAVGVLALYDRATHARGAVPDRPIA